MSNLSNLSKQFCQFCQNKRNLTDSDNKDYCWECWLKDVWKKRGHKKPLPQKFLTKLLNILNK